MSAFNVADHIQRGNREGPVSEEPITTTAVIVREEHEGALQRAFGAFSPAVLSEQVQLVQQVMAECMHEGEHWGKIPGCGDKPTLLKAGAEKLAFVFRMCPEYDIIERDLGDGHREYRVTCRLIGINTGKTLGTGVGVCSTMESKYRWRLAELTCPACGKPTIIKGKEEYGGGWLCFAKKGGCGAKYADQDAAITGQPRGRVENPDIADVYNTVLKIAKKRSNIDATLTATAASDIFAQDLEDVADHAEPEKQQKPSAQAEKPAVQTPRPAPAPAPTAQWKPEKRTVGGKVILVNPEGGIRQVDGVEHLDYVPSGEHVGKCVRELTDDEIRALIAKAEAYKGAPNRVSIAFLNSLRALVVRHEEPREPEPFEIFKDSQGRKRLAEWTKHVKDGLVTRITLGNWTGLPIADMSTEQLSEAQKNLTTLIGRVKYDEQTHKDADVNCLDAVLAALSERGALGSTQGFDEEAAQ